MVVDALSRKHSALTSLRIKVVGFDVLRDMYKEDAEFRKFWESCVEKHFKDFMIVDGFLLKGNALCIPSCSLGLSKIE